MLPRLPRKIVINWSSTPFHRKCVPYYSVIEIAPFWMSQRASDNSPMLAALSSARRGSALLVFASLSLWKVIFFLSFIAFLLLPSLPAENFLWKAPAILVNCFFCVLLKLFSSKTQLKSQFYWRPSASLLCAALPLYTHRPPSVSGGWIHGTVGCTLAQNIMSPVVLQLISQMFPEAGILIKRLHEWPRQQR